MCGISGIIDFENNSIDQTLLKRMCKIQAHRGPDDQGIYTDKNVGLGQRRLSIIDLSSAGHQPMSNEDGTIWITHNGEVYNFKEIRSELEKKGHKFNSDTDTEMIVHAYEEYGPKCVEKFNGMFAFVIWDGRKKELFMARDRIGQKPLYYFIDKNKIVFASEMKAILLHPDVKRKIRLESIRHYMKYMVIPNPETIFEKIHKLEPGHTLTFNKKGTSKRKYWQLKFNIQNKPIDYFKKKIIQELKKAIELRMISDVPLGAFLSGGVDSSAMVALMSEVCTEPIKTFSIGFGEKEYDETKYARIIAEKYRTEHKELYVEPNAIKIVPKIVWHYDEPYADASAIPTYYVSQLTRKYVTVAISGDAGDENFGGYDRYIEDTPTKVLQKVPKFLKGATRIANNVLLSNLNKKLFDQIDRKIKLSSLTPEERYDEIRSAITRLNEKEIFTQEILNKTTPLKNPRLERFKEAGKLDILSKKMYVDINTYLPDDILPKVDIAAMANSLETRAPMLDYNFVEMAATIPSQYKIKNGDKKHVFKQALLPYVPKKVMYRPKHGFSVPLDIWFRKQLKTITQEILLDKETIKRGYFNKKYIEKLLEQHTKYGIDHSTRIWSLLEMEIWHRMYMGDLKKIEKPQMDIYKLT